MSKRMFILFVINIVNIAGVFAGMVMKSLNIAVGGEVAITGALIISLANAFFLSYCHNKIMSKL